MQLVINSYGSYLHIVQDSFEIKLDEKKRRISPKKIDSILITNGCYLSSDAIQLALENKIEIQFLDKYGSPIGKVWHSKMGRTNLVRRKQLKLQDISLGVDIVKSLMIKKSQNMVTHLHKLSLRRNSQKTEYINNSIKYINERIRSIGSLDANEIDLIRYELMGYEGNISKKYFDVLSNIVPPQYKFSGRSYRPAKDEFNCYLNYGYGILYSKIEKALIIAGLDPYIGILHTDNYNKKSFVFDFIEPYRHYIDEIVIKLFTRKKIKKEHFSDVKGGLMLNDEGKKVIIQSVNELFDETKHYDGREIEIKNIMQYDAHKLANRILEEVELC